MKRPSSNITIDDIGSEEKNSWSRYISFSCEGKEYEVMLSWNDMDGYDLEFYRGDEAILNEDLKDPDEQGIESILDDLTWEGNK
jgi:hypothetical protein